MIKTVTMSGAYMDSTLLMRLSRQIKELDGVVKAVAVMGTDMNKTVLEEFGALNEKTSATNGNDLIVAVDATRDISEKEIIGAVNGIINAQKESNSDSQQQKLYPSIQSLIDEKQHPNLAIISLPGNYAADEARNALELGLHVFIFSDNVPLEEEVELKKLGKAKNLLVMGPGAGTAVIDDVAIGLMSNVRPGHIGIVAASGSGLQEVAVLAHRYGHGISQAIGTGGRDLSLEVGGSTMLQGIRLLQEDEDTNVIVLVSKPPHPNTALKIYNEVRNGKKPIVIFFLGGDKDSIRKAGAYYAPTLEAAARIACSLDDGQAPLIIDDYMEQYRNALRPFVDAERARLTPQQKYMRGLFCGGTHSEEAVTLLQDFVPFLHSNIHFGKAALLENSKISIGNTLVDMGDEEFTRGKPHPVMDPSILNERLLQEGRDPEVGVILFDLILGYPAVHPDPVGTIEETISQIQSIAASERRYISLIASICGTDIDPQQMVHQVNRLTRLGVRVLESNCRAALAAGMIVS